MKLSIQLHLAGLSLSNTVSFLELFGVDRARSTVHDWVHKADLQPRDDQIPDHVAIDETVIQLDDERYWLYAAVDPDSNELPHTKLESTRANVLARAFFTELREKHDVEHVASGPDLGKGAANDSIAAFSRQSDRIVVTYDDDFVWRSTRTTTEQHSTSAMPG